MVYWWL